MIKLGDKIIFFAVVTASLLWLFVFNPMYYAKVPKETICVYVEDILLYQVNFGEEKYIKLDNNLVKIEKNYVEIIEANCKDNLCVGKKIESAGQSIVCLPNKVIVTIEGKNEEDEIAY